MASHYPELAAASHSVYLNTGAAGPMPRCAYDVIRQEAEYEFLHGRVEQAGKQKFFGTLEHLRGQLGRLLSTAPANIAVTHCTSDGVNIVLWGLPLRAGDHVLTTDFEHPGGVAGLATLCKARGVTASFYQPERDGFDLDAFFQLATDRTRLIVISHVSWTSGQLVPLKELCQRASERDILVLADGAQSVGVISVDVEALGVDFYTFPGQKWLLGPEGVGGLYIAPRRLGVLQQTHAGVFSFAQYDGRTGFVPKEGGARFEIGTRFRCLLPAWSASLEWLGSHVGWDTVFTRTPANANRFISLLTERTRLRPVLERSEAGLVSFELPEHVPAVQLVAALDAKRIHVRTVPGRNRVRASTAFFNTDNDFLTLVEELRAVTDPRT